MIRRVRRQFICITMSMLTAVLLIPLVALNAVTEAMSYNQTKDLLEQIAISETAVPEKPNDAPPDGKKQSQEEQTGTSATDTSETQTVTTETTTETTAVTEAAAESKAAQTQQARNEEETPAVTEAPQTPAVQQTTAAPKQTAAPQTAAPKETAAAPKQTQAPQEQQPDNPPDDNPRWWEWDDPDWQKHEQEEIPMAAVSGDTPTLSISAAGLVALTQQSMQQMSASKPEQPPLPDKKDDGVTIDHFLCFANAEGTLMTLDGTEDYTEADAQVLLDYVIDSGETDGRYGNLQYFRKDYDQGILVVFSDRSAEQLLLHKVLLVSVLVFFAMEGVVLVLTMLLTKRAMRPMQETFDRQRQFISDAGHELKTPLTIISANVDILHDEIGENKWLSYIRSQAERMRVLVGEMMNLTKLEMGDKKKDFAEFSLSEAVSGAALPFEGQAFEQEKKLELDIADGISYYGNSDRIKQLVGIFMDNALKYSNDRGEIRVTLQQAQNRKTLKIYNTGKGIPPEESEKIFERFYRSDASRARATGGYGLGLSIAKSIAETHKIKIQVESEYEHWICFILTF